MASRSPRARRPASSGAALPFPEDLGAPPARFVGGIDEAGLGPLLGPLTIGFGVFRVPEPSLDLWHELPSAVSRTLDPGDEERIVVADSKVVFDRTPRGEA